MKIAIVHDFLNQKIGGAESVFFTLAEIYPQADLYALIYNKRKFKKFLNKRKVHTSKLQHYPSILKRNPKYLLPFIKKAIDAWNFDQYDLVITSSTAWAKNIKTNKKTKHLCYCHSPARMLWDSWPKYLNDNNIRNAKKMAVIKIASKMRLWDFYNTKYVDQFIANSQYVKKRIAKFYHQDAKVIYPAVNISFFEPNWQKADYYLIVSVLAKYKNIDLAIKAFKKNKKRLIIAGDGPDKDRLQQLARGQKNIEFVGYTSDQQKIRLLALAKALIFCSIEDFGITPIEAMASSTPVIALRGGGLNETIIEKKTGIFFNTSDPISLNNAISKFEKLKFSSKDLVAQAYKFDKKIFIKKIKQTVKSLSKNNAKRI